MDRRRPLGQPAHQLKVIFEPPTAVHPTRPSNARVSTPREATSPPVRNACGLVIMESMVTSCLSRRRCFLKLTHRETRFSYSMSYEVSYPGESPLLKRDLRNLILISTASRAYPDFQIFHLDFDTSVSRLAASKATTASEVQALARANSGARWRSYKIAHGPERARSPSDQAHKCSTNNGVCRSSSDHFTPA